MSDSTDHQADHAGAEWEPALDAVRDLSLAMAEYRHLAAAHFGVGVTETMAISYLRRGPMTGRDLAGAMGLAPSSITSVIDRLAAAGLAERSAVPGDRRAMLVTLTSAGEQVLEWSRHRLGGALSSMGEDRLAEVTAVMGAFAMALRAEIRRQQKPS